MHHMYGCGGRGIVMGGKVGLFYEENCEMCLFTLHVGILRQSSFHLSHTMVMGW